MFFMTFLIEIMSKMSLLSHTRYMIKEKYLHICGKKLVHIKSYLILGCHGNQCTSIQNLGKYIASIAAPRRADVSDAAPTPMGAASETSASLGAAIETRKYRANWRKTFIN